jgi:putative redox protein
MRVSLKHEGGIGFRAKVRGHEFLLDTAGPHGQDRGPTPKEFLLAAIADCSGMDVVSILSKRSVPFDSLEVVCEGKTGDRLPKVFHEANLVFDVRGANVPLERVIEAVEQSLTLYCGVSANVARTTAIFYAIVLNGETQFRGQAAFKGYSLKEQPE